MKKFHLENKCDECKEIIDDKPKNGWLGFSTTKTGYTYCGRCTALKQKGNDTSLNGINWIYYYRLNYGCSPYLTTSLK